MKMTVGLPWVVLLAGVALASCGKKSEPSEVPSPHVARAEQAQAAPVGPAPEALELTPPPEAPPAEEAMPDEEEPSVPDSEVAAPTPGQRLDHALEKTEEGVRKAIEKTGEALQRAGEAIERKAEGE
jgi:predicted small secreted protein